MNKYKTPKCQIKTEKRKDGALTTVIVNGQEFCRLIISGPLCDTPQADWECSASLEWRTKNIDAVYMESTSKVYADSRDYDEEILLIRNRKFCKNAYPHLHLRATNTYKKLESIAHNPNDGKEY